jgi:small subunit ribosomal protein S6
MRLYEIVYIFDAALDEAGVNLHLEEHHPLLTQVEGAEIVAVDHWGARQLAYPIDKKKTGYYVVAQVRTDPEALPEFERRVGLNEQIMRYLVVLNEGEPTRGMSIQKPDTRVREDDDDDRGGPDDDGDAEIVTHRSAPPEFSGGRGRRRRIEGPAIELLNYKDVATLSRFMTEQGKILPKRTTKVTARFQRQLGRAIKRARYLALVPYVRDHEV